MAGPADLLGHRSHDRGREVGAQHASEEPPWGTRMQEPRNVSSRPRSPRFEGSHSDDRPARVKAGGMPGIIRPNRSILKISSEWDF